MNRGTRQISRMVIFCGCMSVFMHGGVEWIGAAPWGDYLDALTHRVAWLVTRVLPVSIADVNQVRLDRQADETPLHPRGFIISAWVCSATVLCFFEAHGLQGALMNYQKTTGTISLKANVTIEAQVRVNSAT